MKYKKQLPQSCDNCRKRIENELNSMDKVNEKVSLKRKEVVVKLGIHMEDSVIIQKIEKLGYRGCYRYHQRFFRCACDGTGMESYHVQL